MTAQPVEPHGYDPDEILRRLPAGERDRFIHEYRSALDAAHEPWRYRQLQSVLRLWYLRSVAYQQPDFAERAAQARAGDSAVFVAAEDVVRGWPERGADAG